MCHLVAVGWRKYASQKIRGTNVAPPLTNYLIDYRKMCTIYEIRFFVVHALLCKMIIKVFGVYLSQKARKYAYIV